MKTSSNRLSLFAVLAAATLLAAGCHDTILSADGSVQQIKKNRKLTNNNLVIRLFYENDMRFLKQF
jgi:hypothetical protein